eukprot:COSAG04_NODE_12069_length_672_cov_1.211169_1_plen_37_part_01
MRAKAMDDFDLTHFKIELCTARVLLLGREPNPFVASH